MEGVIDVKLKFGEVEEPKSRIRLDAMPWLWNWEAGVQRVGKRVSIVLDSVTLQDLWQLSRMCLMQERGARDADSCPPDLDGDEARGGGLSSYYPKADGTENDLWI